MILFILLFSIKLYSQKGYELGGWLGTSYYFGDLNTNLKIVKPGIAGGILARKNFNTRVALRTSLSFARVGADDSDSDNNFERNRNLSFKSNVFDWTNVIEFNFFHYEHGHPRHNKTPYFFGGFNIFHYNPKAEFNGNLYALRPLGTEGQPLGQEYSTVSGGLVLGGGFKFDVNRTISFNIEVSTRFLFTDYLDDVSTVFPDKSALASSRGETAVSLSDRSLVDGIGDTGRQRGDTKGNDKYTFVGISIMKYFGGIECPEISRIKN
ncbi:MAG: hypothetical protein IPN86_00340 [Saprospiraceae bacterium]|nr:hypothetical protein [Saprospiraceae bacterium]